MVLFLFDCNFVFQKFIMTAIMCDDDSLMSDDEFADQSCMDSEDDITGGLGMAEFFVAFKHHHHNRATAFTGMLSGTPSESESDFDADRWKCIECNTANNRSFFRYCEKCWKVSICTAVRAPTCS